MNLLPNSLEMVGKGKPTDMKRCTLVLFAQEVLLEHFFFLNYQIDICRLLEIFLQTFFLDV